MRLNITNFTCLESFDNKQVNYLKEYYGISIGGEVFEFFKNYPSLQLNGSSLLIVPKNCVLTDGILIADFLGLDQIIYLKREGYFERFKYLMDKLEGGFIPIAFSMGENHLIIVRTDSNYKFEVFILDDLKESICYICDGIYNFINYHLLHQVDISD